MSTIDMKTLSVLLAIGQKAVDVQDAKEAERGPREVFNRACRAYKVRNRIDFIARNSDEWDAMCEATADEYAEVAKAERKTYNARRRLETAIRAYRQNGGAR